MTAPRKSRCERASANFWCSGSMQIQRIGNSSTYPNSSCDPKRIIFREASALASVEEAYAKAATDFVKLNELTTEKESLEKKLEIKLERFVYLSDLAERIEGRIPSRRHTQAPSPSDNKRQIPPRQEIR